MVQRQDKASTFSRLRWWLCFPILGWLLSGAGAALAIPSLNHPERNWVVMETPHFYVHYYQDLQRLANRIAEYAEDAYGKVTSDLDARPHDKIPIVLSEDALFNGFAEPVKNRIVLDPRLARTSAIGTRRFITHEFTHIINFEAYNTGLPISKLINAAPVPPWFFEGVAQYEAEYWYPSFDRLLRLHTLNGSLLTTTERDAFTVLGGSAGSQGYNEGYSWLKYVLETYGRDKLPKLMAASRTGTLNFHTIVEQVLNTNYYTLEANWRQHLIESYSQQTRGREPSVAHSTPVLAQKKQEIILQARLSPDGKKLAYLSSTGREGYLEIRGVPMGSLPLYLADPDGSKVEKLVARGVVDYAWSPDGRRIAYVQFSTDDRYTDTLDLYVIDWQKKKTERITTGAYVTGVTWSPDGKQLAIASTRNEIGNIEVGDPLTKKFSPITHTTDERQYDQLAWSPDGQWIAAGIYLPGNGRRLWLVSPDGRIVLPLTGGSVLISDNSPAWSPDSGWIYFVSTRDRFSNLYRVSLDGGRLERLTNTFTGLEAPSLSPDGGTVYFTQHAAVGGAVYRVPVADLAAIPEPADEIEAPRFSVPPSESPPLAPVEARFPTSAYRPLPTPDLIQPFTGTDEQGDLLGISATFSDILNKHEIGALVAYGLSSQRISYLIGYNNFMFAPSFGLYFYDRPGFDITRTRTLPYLERSQGGTFRVAYQLGETQVIGLGFSANFISNLTSAESLGVPQSELRNGWRNQVAIFYHHRSVTPSSDSVINPQNGYMTRFIVAHGSPALGSHFSYYQAVGELRRYIGVPESKHTFAFRLMGGLTSAEGVPFLLGGDKGNIAVGTTELIPLRGYNIAYFPSQSGSRFLLGSAEWRFPINTHLDSALGSIYLDRMYGALFLDVGHAWFPGRSDADLPDSNYPGVLAGVGAEMRLSTALIGKIPFYLVIGVGKALRPISHPVRVYFGFQNVF